MAAFGARFDMEIDAFAIAMLAISVVKAAAVPYWVLAMGAMRYLYLGAGRIFPALARPLPLGEFADRRRKTIVRLLNDIPGVVCPEPFGAFYAYPSVKGALGREIAGKRPQTSSELAGQLG